MLHGRVDPSEDARLHAHFRGQVDKKRFPTRRSIVQGQPRRRGRADGVGSDRRRAAGGGRHEVDRMERAAGPRASCSSGCARRPTGRRRRSTKGRRTRATARGAGRARRRTLKATLRASRIMKHAPIGPTIAVADVRADGTVYVHTHNQNPAGAARADGADAGHADRQRRRPHRSRAPGHYGRSNGGNAGAEDEAVMLSQAVGQAGARAVDAAEDLQWSTQSRRLVLGHPDRARRERQHRRRTQADHYMPAMQDDRLVGAVLAGLPTIAAAACQADVRCGSARSSTASDPWLYDRVPERRGAGARHVPARAGGVAAEGRPSRPQHAHAGRSCSRTSRASWRSTRRPRSRAWIRSSSA